MRMSSFAIALKYHGDLHDLVSALSRLVDHLNASVSQRPRQAVRQRLIIDQPAAFGREGRVGNLPLLLEDRSPILRWPVVSSLRAIERDIRGRFRPIGRIDRLLSDEVRAVEAHPPF